MFEDSVDPISTEIFHGSSRNATLANEVKVANISPIFKLIDSTFKITYRPVSRVKLSVRNF